MSTELFYDEYIDDSIIGPMMLAILENSTGAMSELMHTLELDDSWTRVNNLIDHIVSTDTNKAFEVAKAFILVPPSNEFKTEWHRRYLRGNGVAILYHHAMKDTLHQIILQTEKIFPLIPIFKQMLEINTLHWSQEIALSTPEFFTKIAVLKLCADLGENETLPFIDRLAVMARHQLKNPELQAQIRWYLDIEDTKALAESLEKYMQ